MEFAFCCTRVYGEASKFIFRNTKLTSWPVIVLRDVCNQYGMTHVTCYELLLFDNYTL